MNDRNNRAKLGKSFGLLLAYRAGSSQVNLRFIHDYLYFLYNKLGSVRFSYVKVYIHREERFAETNLARGQQMSFVESWDLEGRNTGQRESTGRTFGANTGQFYLT